MIVKESGFVAGQLLLPFYAFVEQCVADTAQTYGIPENRVRWEMKGDSAALDDIAGLPIMESDSSVIMTYTSNVCLKVYTLPRELEAK